MKRGRVKAALTRPTDVMVEGVTVTHCKPCTKSDRRTVSFKNITGAYGHVCNGKLGVYNGWRDVQQHDKQPLVTTARWIKRNEAVLIKG